MTKANHFEKVLQQLRDTGFLLESDPKLPSVCSIIAGEPMRGSWWSHPMAQTIFQVNEKLEDHPDVLITKLISGKVTFVHRDLWSDILAIGTAREAWQMSGLSAAARALLTTIEDAASLRTDQLPKKSKPGDLARELERRLLIHAEQGHTDSGAHAKFLETWDRWSKRKQFIEALTSADQARQTIEERLRELNEKFTGTARLPWA